GPHGVHASVRRLLVCCPVLGPPSADSSTFTGTLSNITGTGVRSPGNFSFVNNPRQNPKPYKTCVSTIRGVAANFCRTDPPPIRRAACPRTTTAYTPKGTKRYQVSFPAAANM